MSTALAIGRNIRMVRNEKGMTQHDVYEATGISTSQLSSYENGKQMIGLTSLAKIAVALGTSIDRLYFGTPSEAFLNETEDFGETVVNCFKKLHELGVISNATHSMGGGKDTATVEKCGYELARMFSTLREFSYHKDYYPDTEAFLDQLYKSISNEINEHSSRNKRSSL